MWTKIFLILFAVAFFAMGVLTYLPYSWLQSRGFAPNFIAENFLSYGTTYWTGLWIFTLALLIPANVILWLNRRAWALWLAFLFFSFFVLLRTWWLNEVYVSFAGEHNLIAETLFGYGILGVLLCIIAAVGVFFNQFLVLRMRDRVHHTPKPSEAVVAAEDNSPGENSTEENSTGENSTEENV